MDYETLGIFVPEEYMTGVENSDGMTYTCTINPQGSLGGYTAKTAPVVLPVDTPGYSAMKPPEGFEDTALTYTEKGFIYVRAGCRGRDSGAPAGVADLKAAIRYVRYYESDLPGDYDSLFVFGHSGGGAQSAVLGTTGNSDIYADHLNDIGALSKEESGGDLIRGLKSGKKYYVQIRTYRDSDGAVSGWSKKKSVKTR